MEKLTKDHPLAKSEDILQSNIETLKKLFPTVVREGKIDLKELESLLSDEVETNEEYYRFTWAGKSDARREANKPSTATLLPCKDDSKNWDETENIFIAGDNLEVLKLLQKSYVNQIKMIYIDPPYNTGKDFVYKDNYKDNLGNYLAITGQTNEEGKRISTNTESDGRYHSNWLNMMYPRLKLARNLLKNDGAIFISLDDNEIYNLRKICDEIFGEENFVSCITVVNNPRGRDYGGVARMHEYIMVYVKSFDAEINDLNEPDKVFPYEDDISGFELRELRNRNIAFNSENRPNLYYPFYVNPENKDKNELYEISLEKKENWVELFPKESQGMKTVWRWGKPKSLENMNVNIAGKGMEDGGYQIVEKYRKKTRMARSVWWDKEDNTEKGTLLVKSLFEKKVFDFPKPIEMISKLIEMGTNPNQNDIVLDFFAGSGSTAHSVMKLNAEIGSNRKFISVQLPDFTYEPLTEEITDSDGEKKKKYVIDKETGYPKVKKDSNARKEGYFLLSDICKERIRRAGIKIVDELESKIKAKHEKQATELNLKNESDDKISDEEILRKLDIGFKSFKLETSNINAWDGNVSKFEQNLLSSETNIKIDRTEEDVLFEVLLKYGLNLTVQIEERTIEGCKIFSVGLGALFVCLSNNITTKVADGIGNWKTEQNPVSCRVLFRDNGFPDDVAKTNSVQILKRFGINEINSL